MNERPRYGYSASEPASPWPAGAAAPAPIAAPGFVVPGIASGHAAPPVMVAYDGTIGSPPQQLQQTYAPVQAWAFPTPHGLRLVQPGAVTTLQSAAETLTSAAATLQHAHHVRHRIRWETIVPMLAMLCLIVSIGVFIHDFDRITGRETTTSPAPATQASKTSKRAATADTPRTTPSKAATRARAAHRARVQARRARARALRRRTVARQRAAAAARQARNAAPSRAHSPAPAPPGAATGGGGGSATHARPPANVPQGAIPQRPDIPNPTGGTGAGAAAVTGGGGASNCTWMVMDGEPTCM